MGYRVLFTDVGNVIAPFFLVRFTRSLSRLCGLSEAEVDARLYREMSGRFTISSQACQGLHRNLLLGSVGPEEYFAEVKRRLECELSPEAFWPAFRRVFDPNPRLVRLWDSLRREGKIERIIIVSDADPCRLAECLDTTGFEPDGIVASYEVGQLKPHAEMFRRALELARVPAEECLFVDDLDANVTAARKHGIESFCYLYPEVDLDSATDILVGEFRSIGLVD
jgi:FMN phosphatase YigB (HAD superfamily)